MPIDLSFWFCMRAIIIWSWSIWRIRSRWSYWLSASSLMFLRHDFRTMFSLGSFVILLNHVQRQCMNLLLYVFNLLSLFIRNFRFLSLFDQLCIFEFLSNQRLFILLIFVLLFLHVLLLLLDYISKFRLKLNHVVILCISQNLLSFFLVKLLNVFPSDFWVAHWVTFDLVMVDWLTELFDWL